MADTTHNDWTTEYERILEQEKGLDFSAFGYEDAWAVGSGLVATAREKSLPIVVSIMFGEQRVFHAALEGSSAVNDDWVGWKFNVVRRHNLSSYGVGCQYRAQGRSFDADSRYGTDSLYGASGFAGAGGFAAAGGAVPIRVAGSLVGVVGVSGLAEADDHSMVVDALAAHIAVQKG